VLEVLNCPYELGDAHVACSAFWTG
jgi:hypothetical protein